MEISDSQARLIRDCVVETVLHRQRTGAPIPQRVRDLLAYVSAGGHQCGCDATQSEQHDDMIDTAAAATILGCTRRHIRRLAADLDGQQIGREWIFRRATVTEYAEAKNGRTAR